MIAETVFGWPRMASISDYATYKLYMLFKEDMLKVYVRHNINIQEQP